MLDFLIITPTIPGRLHYLRRLIRSMSENDFSYPDISFKHVICGDGFKEFYCTDSIPKSGNWGYPIRNEMLKKYTETSYVLFVDDDNILLPGAFGVLKAQFGSPIIVSQMLELPSGTVFPGKHPIRAGTIGTLNFCIRLDIAKQVQFGMEYEADYKYYEDCLKIAGKQVVIPQITSVWTRKGI